MSIIVRAANPKRRPPEAPPTFPGNPPPSTPPKDWEKKLKFQDLLDRQNPTMTLTAEEVLTHTRTSKDQEDEDDAKKRRRHKVIKTRNRDKRKSWNSNVSGTGTMPPILGSYPSGTVDTAGTGFSWSDIPSIVWIILAVGIGVFVIKSAGKGKRK